MFAFIATSDNVRIGSPGNVNVNSPFAVVQTLAVMIVFAIFVVVAMVAGTVIRDDETGFAPILRSTRLTEAAYLTSRFAGSIAAALLVLAAVPLAIALGPAMPWQDAEQIGPFVAGHDLCALFVFGLPTLPIAGAAFFALATATRSSMWTHVGAVAMLVLFSGTRVWVRDLQHDTFAALSDPFALSALAIGAKYWTAADRNLLLPPSSGLLLANRLLWIGIAAALYALAWRLFHFETRAGKATAKSLPNEAPAPRSAPLPLPRLDAATRRAWLWALARFGSRRSPCST